VEKVSTVDYRVRYNNGGTKVYYINMLKRWLDREGENEEQFIATACIANHLDGS
jgi:hypothetical protein